MPPGLACKFTTGELAVLKIVADEVRTKGACVLSVAEMAARSGTSESTVRRAFRAAVGLMTVQERRVAFRPNLTNVIRIISREWLAWIKKARTTIASQGWVSNAKGHGQQGFTRG